MSSEESSAFNSLLVELKQLHAPTPAKPKQTHGEFYAKMAQAEIRPIHEGEVPDSTFTEDEAAKFYTSDDSIPTSAPIAIAPPSDEADLFDSME